MATVDELLRTGVERLRASGSETPRLDAELLLANALGTDRTAVIAHPEAPVAHGQESMYAAHLARREAGEPVAYIRGFKEFYGLRFAVDERVLIPRPETEVLVDAVRDHVAGRALTLVDVGTGCGAIAIALAVHEPSLRVIATDVTPDALAVARANAAAHEVRIDFREGDLLAPIVERIDVVAANLPYLRDDALATLTGDRTSLAYEPRVATAAGPDGLALIRRAAAELPRVLVPDGAAFFECDPPQAAEVAALLAPLGTVEVLRDLSGAERVARVRRTRSGPDLLP